MPIRAQDAVDDLGVASTCSKKWFVKSVRKRINKGDKRARRVGKLALVSSAASRLYMSGVRPQQEYDACIVGCAPEQVRKMRTSAVRCMKKAGCQPCSTSILRWRVGREADPFCRIPRNQIMLCSELWRAAQSNAEHAEAMAKAWNNALQDIILKKNGWKGVTGPLSATMAVLHQAGWKPIQPAFW